MRCRKAQVTSNVRRLKFPLSKPSPLAFSSCAKSFCSACWSLALLCSCASRSRLLAQCQGPGLCRTQHGRSLIQVARPAQCPTCRHLSVSQLSALRACVLRRAVTSLVSPQAATRAPGTLAGQAGKFRVSGGCTSFGRSHLAGSPVARKPMRLRLQSVSRLTPRST